jgi:hypothetical protein
MEIITYEVNKLKIQIRIQKEEEISQLLNNYVTFQKSKTSNCLLFDPSVNLQIIGIPGFRNSSIFVLKLSMLQFNLIYLC